MKRTVNINLGGQVFQIDEDAFEVLEKYIQALKDKYLNTEGGSEIINDIEMRLAEMFFERLTDHNVVSITDVEEVIKIMGHPEDFGSADDEEEDYGHDTKGQKKTSSKTSTSKRLFRDPDDKVLAGLLSGMSAYLGIGDPIWLRLLFIVLFFAGFGSTLLIYIVLAIIIPKAKTTSEKLQMRGEDINIDNIERTIRTGLNDLASSFGSNGGKRSGHQRLSNAIDSLANLLVLILKAIGTIIGFGFVAIGICGFIAMAVLLLIPSSITGFTVFEYLSLWFSDDIHMVLAVIAAGIVILIPLFSLLLIGIRLIVRRRSTHMQSLSKAMAILFVVGVILAFYVAARQGLDSTNRKLEVTTTTLTKPESDVLNLDLVKDEVYNNEYFSTLGMFAIHIENDVVYMRDRITLDIEKSTSGEYELETTYSARGNSPEKAYKGASNISYSALQRGDELVFPVAFSFYKEDGLNAQSVSMVLKIPVGGAVYLSEDMNELIYDIDNVTDTYDWNMVGHTWIMLPEGLTCMDCEGSKVDLSTPKSTDDHSDVVIPEPFTELTIKGYTELELIQSDDYRIELLGEDDDLSSMVDQSGDKLTIDAGKTISNILNNKGLVKIVVFTPTLDELNISGSSNTNIKSFKGDALDIEVDGACDCSFTLDVDELELDLSGATEVVVKGEAEKTVIDMKGASELDASELQVEDMTIEMAGACEATVRVKDKLNADLDGLSELIYIGSPEILSEVSGFSSIKPRN